MLKQLFTDNWQVSGDGIVSRMLTLPHDASMENGRDPKAPSAKSGAYYKPGRYEYTKTIPIPGDWADKTAYLVFEGVYPSAKVLLNGQVIGGCGYGYSEFTIPLTDLKAGTENQISVQVDDTGHPNSRWYAGAGIYRPVWIMTGNETYIKPDGIRITTKSLDPAVVSIEVCTEGRTPLNTIEVEITETGNTGESEAVKGRILSVRDLNENDAVIEYQIDNAKLWSAENPNLYECRLLIKQEGKSVDEAVSAFGIRQISWSDRGFFINGHPVLLKGGCLHHDNGVLGACSYRESEFRKVKILKEHGYNAVRSAHNPMGEDLLAACDALGMYVLDEAWDTWYKTKNPYDFGNGFFERYEKDLEQMVAKDYNHPSVIMYSIGNEVTEPAKKKGLELTDTLVGKLHELDKTRPVTAGINITLLMMAKLPFDPIAIFAGDASKSEETDGEQSEKHEQKQEVSSEQYNKMMARAGSGMNNVNSGFIGDLVSRKVYSKLDIAGYNYGITRYEKEGKLHPERVIVGTETYCQDIGRTWPLVERLPYVIGDFMWTAWDHLGEVGIGGYSYDREDFTFERKYPWKLSNAGAIDILGNDTAEAGLARVVFNHEMTPYIGVTPANHPGEELATAVWRGTNALPSWSYHGCDGNPVTAEVYSCADTVELFVNGRSLGREKLKDFKAVYSLPYESGVIRAAAYDEKGEAAGESELHSADADNLKIRIRQEESCLNSGETGQIVYFDISIADSSGNVEMNSDRRLTVQVTGGELLGFGSARPKTGEEFTTGCYTTYLGRAQAVIRMTGANGEIVVSDEQGNKTGLKFH